MTLYKIIAKPQFVRVTSLAMWFDCRHNWSQKFIFNRKEESSPSAKIGTAAHAIIENYIKGGFNFNAVIGGKNIPLWQQIPQEEWENLTNYLRMLADERWIPIACEHEFNLNIASGQPMLRGHIDMLAVKEDDPESIYIVDHKTNRQFEGAEVWRKKLQQLFYAYAVRRLYPQYKRVWFVMGYINLNRFVAWETDPADDATTEKKFLEFCTELDTACKMKQFPRTFSENCKWCVERNTCSVLQNQLEGFHKSVEERLIGVPDEERYAMLDAVSKVAGKLKDEAADRLVERVLRGEEVKTTDDMYRFVVTYSERRELPVEDVFRIMCQLGIIGVTNPDQVEAIAGTMSTLMSGKVTGLDSIKKTHPELHTLLTPLVVKKTGTNPLLKLVKATSQSEELPPGEK